MNELPRPCPDCGTPLPAESPQALCPACLMRQALASRTLDDEGSATSAPPPPWSPEEIADKFPGYEILECLGRGGMGVVYQARQKSLDRMVAIKILPPERVGEEKFSERFAIEAATLAKLSHPNIVTVHDFGETGGLFYIVMEYVDGVNLRDLLREGKLEPQQALAIVPPVCDALQYAHDKGIVHRDIKPENLLLDKDGRIKIADFGIAKLIDPVAAVCDRRTSPEEGQRRSQTAATVMAGTQGYSAPEQFTGTADHRADIYALGVVLYEMLTGERPGKEIVAPSKRVLLDVRIDEMVLRALEKEPERRYQTAGEFRTMVETIGSTPDRAKPPAIPASSPPRGMIRRWWWLFGVMIPVGLALGLAAGVVLTYIIPKKYEARAIIEVRTPAAARTTPRFFDTELEKLTSPGVLMKVSDRLDLSNRWMQQRDRVISTLKDLVAVNNSPGTDLILIRVRHTNPEETAEIANMLAGIYRETSPNELIVYEAAVVPRKPSSPKPAFLMLIGALAGVMASPLLALSVMVVLHRLIPARRHQTAGGIRTVVETTGGETTGVPATGLMLLGTGLHGLLLLGIVLALALLVPNFQELLASFDAQLPLAARVVLALSRFVLNGGWLLFPLLLAVDLLICRLLLRSASRKPFAIWVVTVLLGMIVAAILGGAALSIPIARLITVMNDVDSERILGATVDGRPPGKLDATPVAAESTHEGSEPKKEPILPNAYKVTVGGGCEFEILGVLRDPRNSTQWLHPDGTPLASPPVEIIDLSEAIPADPKQVVSPRNEVLVCFRMTPTRPLTSIGIGFPSKSIPLLKPVEVKVNGITPGDPPLVQHFAPADRNSSSMDLTVMVVFENSGWRPLAEFDLKQTLERQQGAEVRFEPLQFDEARQTSTIRASSKVQLSYDSFRLAIHLRNGNTSYVSVWHDPAAIRNAGGFGFIREVQSPWGPEMAVITPDTIRKIVFEHAPPILGTIKNIHLPAGTGGDPNADRILLEDLALHLIVAIREKDDAKLKSLASDRIKGWPEALPVFAVELREHMRQFTGNDKFDLRAGESLVDGDFAAVRCTGPAELDDKCLVLFFVKSADGWRNHSLCNSVTITPLAQLLADLKKKSATTK